jgi:hypothetical protein
MSARFVGEIPVLTLATEQLGNMVLTWLDMSHGDSVSVVKYHVWRQIDDALFLEIATPTSLSYADTTATSGGVAYRYYIACEYISGAISLPSNIVTGCPPDLMYLFGSNSRIYAVDIRNRLAPVLVQTNDLWHEMNTNQAYWDRMLIDDTHLYVGCDNSSQKKCYVYNYDSAGNLTFQFTPWEGENLQSFMVRPNQMIWLHGHLAQRITVGMNNEAIDWDYLASMGGEHHHDTFCFDPKTNQAMLWGGGDYSYSLRMSWGVLTPATNFTTEQSGYDAPQEIQGGARMTQTRSVVQTRPGLSSLVWIAIDGGGWYGYVSPCQWSPYTRVGYFNIPSLFTAYYGRCYLRGNYLFITMRTTRAGCYGVEIINLTDPANPVRMTGLEGLGGTACDVLFVDEGTIKYLYVLKPTGKTVQIYNITDVANPMLLSTWTNGALSAVMGLIARKNNFSQYAGNNGFILIP